AIVPGVVKAVYAGDPSHLRSVSRGKLTVSATSTSLTLSPVDGRYDDSAFADVKLTSRGKPMSDGQVIHFYLNGQSIGAATTDSSGRASARLSLRQTPLNAGVYPNIITAVYEGSKVARRSVAVATLTVERAPLSVTLSNLAQTYDGTPKLVTTGAFLVPIGWKGSVDYSGIPLSVTYTDSSGHVIAAPTAVGSYHVSATVADPNYVGDASGTLVISPP
ncbi:MBG domain-containing protein, partial [Singulisphaera rosea]